MNTFKMGNLETFRLNAYPLEDPYRIVPTVFIRRQDTYKTAALSRFMEAAGIVDL